MEAWISRHDKYGTPKDLTAPDGTRIEIYYDKNIVVTPDGYRVQIDLMPPSFLILSKLDNYDGKQDYEEFKHKMTTKEN